MKDKTEKLVQAKLLREMKSEIRQAYLMTQAKYDMLTGFVPQKKK